MVTQTAIWMMLHSLMSFDSVGQWQTWMELQPRWDSNPLASHQVIVRPGVGYYLNPQLSLWAGYAYIGTYRPSNQSEHRLWQQLLWIPQRAFVLRVRSEERFFSNGNELRFRFLVRSVIDGFPIPIIVSNELFLNAYVWRDRSTATGYDQNRAFVGLWLALWDGLRIEAGYMNVHYRDKMLRHVASISVIHQP